MKKINKFNLNSNFINNAFEFYGINIKYKNLATECYSQVFSNKVFKKNFLNLFNTLYNNFCNMQLEKLWHVKNVEVVFGNGVNPFVTNLMILAGYEAHKHNMEFCNYNKQQIKLHKKRVRECFINDIEKRKYNAVRISQMLWATYFINAKIIEVGILQYEYDEEIKKIKIHIPSLKNLNIEKVEISILKSKEKFKKYFNLTNPTIICESWLLSKQITKFLKPTSNIKNFQELFLITNGENCNYDILNFVFKKIACENYNELDEKTSLQKSLKQAFLKGENFYKGMGVLKINK